MRYVAIAFALLLSGCALAYSVGPNHKPEKKMYSIYVFPHKSIEDVNEMYKKLYPDREDRVLGFAIWGEHSCSVHYMYNDWLTLVHEIKHCYYGYWHK